MNSAGCMELLLTLKLNNMSHIANERWAEDRRQWLEERDCTEDKVLTDADGTEYIIVKLPEKLQKNYEPDDKQD